MSPQRRTALVSVVAAVGADGDQARDRSRERQPRPRLRGAALGHRPRRGAAHVLRGRRRRPSPPTPAHPYGHGKAEHLAALAEAAFLVARQPRRRRARASRGSPAGSRSTVDADLVGVRRARGRDRDRRLARRLVSSRAARRYESAALASNALHFGERPRRHARGARRARRRARRLAGRRLGRRALRRACSCSWPPSRLIRRNVDVLMDRAPADAVEAARRRSRRSTRPSSCGGCGCGRRPAARSPTS